MRNTKKVPREIEGYIDISIIYNIQRNGTIWSSRIHMDKNKSNFDIKVINKSRNII